MRPILFVIAMLFLAPSAFSQDKIDAKKAAELEAQLKQAQSKVAELKAELAKAEAAVAELESKIGKKQVTQVTAKEIEIFGNEMVGQRRQMSCKFVQVSDALAKNWKLEQPIVGILVIDSKNNFFNHAFADKGKFGREFVQMNNGDSIIISGQVQAHSRAGNVTYIFVIDEVVKVKK